MSEQTYQAKANQMIREGCTQGMLFQYLEKQGLREHEIAPIIRLAFKVNSLRQRLIGLAILIFGLAVLTGACLWINLDVNVEQLPPQIALVVAMCGLLISIAGLVRMASTGARE
jgi:hypothetical protein